MRLGRHVVPTQAQAAVETTHQDGIFLATAAHSEASEWRFFSCGRGPWRGTRAVTPEGVHPPRQRGSRSDDILHTKVWSRSTSKRPACPQRKKMRRKTVMLHEETTESHPTYKVP